MKWHRGAGTAVGLVLILLSPSAVHAQLSKQERESAKTMTSGTLYLRLDVPCKYADQGLGLSVESLLEVSPTGHDYQRKLNLPDKRKHRSVYWGFLPNDAVHYAKLSFNGEKVQLWMEGVSPNDEIMIDFVGIKSMESFTEAFNQTFSKVPLQDEHQDWSADIRQAVAGRKLISGMTKEQAFVVVGTPINVTFGEENGVKAETWFLRQDKGTKNVFRKDKTVPTGFPSQLKFVDGKLQTIEQTPRSPDSTTG